MILPTLQAEVHAWNLRNFPNPKGDSPDHCLLGLAEEVGELCHAHLKREQGIRGTAEEHHAKAKDAIGDVVVFLAAYCGEMGYDLQECVEAAWAEAKGRDWTANPETGKGSKPCE